MKKKLKVILLIGWMVVIFYYSAQPAVVSNEKSHFLINAFNTLGLDLNSIWGNLANFIVRKIAHFTEYMILYIISYYTLKEYFDYKKALRLSLMLVFLYACSDEIHQFYVPGRAARVADVLIDTCGGLFAYLVFTIKYKKTIIN